MRELPLYRCKLERAGVLLSPYAVCSRTSQAAEVLRMLIGESDREHFACLYMDRENTVLGAELVSIGDQNEVRLWVENVFRGAIVGGADKLVVAHNHVRVPAKPSDSDRELTRELVRAGEIIGIQVVDHVVLATDGTHYSFHAHGQIKKKRSAAR